MKSTSANLPRARDAEPEALMTPAPVWLLVLLGVLLFWGMRYLDHRGGGFHPAVFAISPPGRGLRASSRRWPSPSGSWRRVPIE